MPWPLMFSRMCALYTFEFWQCVARSQSIQRGGNLRIWDPNKEVRWSTLQIDIHHGLFFVLDSLSSPPYSSFRELVMHSILKKTFFPLKSWNIHLEHAYLMDKFICIDQTAMQWLSLKIWKHNLLFKQDHPPCCGRTRTKNVWGLEPLLCFPGVTGWASPFQKDTAFNT